MVLEKGKEMNNNCYICQNEFCRKIKDKENRTANKYHYKAWSSLDSKKF